jgi:hypothetical protein
MNTRTVRRVAILGVLAACAAVCGSCGKVAREGRSPGFLVIGSLTAASGAKPDQFDFVLESDVVTNVKQTIGSDTVYVPTIFEDFGQVSLRVVLKDPGTPASPASPTALNEITVNRYHVVFKRADGRNTPGTDVPYPFDGAVTATIGGTATTVSFVLVRAQAKIDPPLKALRNIGSSQLISTLAEVTFYGQDQTGNAVSVTGTISVNFADWGDPD